MSETGAYVCESCGSGNIDVVRTVNYPAIERVTRRRQCLDCGSRFTTDEYRRGAISSAHGDQDVANTSPER